MSASLLAMRGTSAPPSPQVAAQVNLVNAVTRSLIFSRVSLATAARCCPGFSMGTCPALTAPGCPR